MTGLPLRQDEYGVLGEALEEADRRIVAAEKDRALAETALTSKVRELKRSNIELEQFASFASHDLKEPLRGIHNYSGFLLKDYAAILDEEGVSKLQTVSRLAQRMENLINGLLDFSRIGKGDVIMEDTDLAMLVAGVIDSLRIFIEEHNVTITIPEKLPSFSCDQSLVGEVFSNLIANAIKYNSHEKKWVEVGYEKKEELFVFYVRDNGIGIRDQYYSLIFNTFKRLHERDLYGGGTGIGLAIVKKIIVLHHGAIWVESTYGTGTTFYFTLSGKPPLQGGR